MLGELFNHLNKFRPKTWPPAPKGSLQAWRMRGRSRVWGEAGRNHKPSKTRGFMFVAAFSSSIFGHKSKVWILSSKYLHCGQFSLKNKMQSNNFHSSQWAVQKMRDGVFRDSLRALKISTSECLKQELLALIPLSACRMELCLPSELQLLAGVQNCSWESGSLLCPLCAETWMDLSQASRLIS